MKLQINKKPEELEKERAEKQRKIEAEIQQKAIERQAKLQAMRQKQKITRICVILVTTIIMVAMLFFGTYNTFFKKILTTDDVYNAIKVSKNTYPTFGVAEYIKDNCQTIFNTYATVDVSMYEYAKVDTNSVYIDDLTPISNTVARVRYGFDVEVKEQDTVVTDPATIQMLQKYGFFSVNTSTDDTTVDTSTTGDATTESLSPSITENEVNTVEASSKKKKKKTTTEETTEAVTEEATEAPTEVTTEAPTTEALSTEVATTDPSTGTDAEIATIPNNDEDSQYGITVEDTDGAVEYYMTRGGKIKQKGKITKQRYVVTMLVEYYATRDEQNNPITWGYKPASAPSLYSLVNINVTDFNDIDVAGGLEFNKNAALPEDQLNAAKIKVNKTFQDLYSKRDTSQDFFNVKQFNTYDATYVGMEAFEAYSEPNEYGFNAKVIYTIQTPQGFKYTQTSYLQIEASGNSWIIKGIM